MCFWMLPKLSNVRNVWQVLSRHFKVAIKNTTLSLHEIFHLLVTKEEMKSIV